MIALSHNIDFQAMIPPDFRNEVDLPLPVGEIDMTSATTETGTGKTTPAKLNRRIPSEFGVAIGRLCKFSSQTAVVVPMTVEIDYTPEYHSTFWYLLTEIDALSH